MTENSVVLRVAEAKDIMFLADVVFRTNQAHQTSGEGWDAEAFRQGLIEEAAEQVAGGVADSTTYVIERGGERVGRLRVVRSRETIEVAGLQVAPEAQGSGAGSDALRRVQAEAADAGRRVVLEVDHGNDGAERQYARLGFRPGGVARWPDRTRLVWAQGTPA